jgi:Cytolethal distending toxin A/C domain
MARYGVIVPCESLSSNTLLSFSPAFLGCITRDYYEGSPNSGGCWWGDVPIPCSTTELFVNQCNLEDPRQRFNFIPVSSDEVLIKAFQEDRCFQRDERHITMETCNEALHTQRWYALRGGFNERRFELSQKTSSTWCVNQDHHPKYGEVMSMHDCEKTRQRNHLTSWWELYQ